MDLITRTIALGAAAAGDEDDYWIFAVEPTNGYLDSPANISVDVNDNVYVTSLPSRPQFGDTTRGHGFPTVFKLDNAGAIQWARQAYHTASGSKDTKKGVACADSSGNVYLACSIDQSEVFYFKWNSSGAQQYRNIINKTSHKVFGGALGSIDEYVFCGEVQESTVEGTFFRINSNGTIDLNRGLFTSSPSRRTSLTGVRADGGTSYVVGKTRDTSASYDQIFLAKINVTGSVIWQKTIQETSTTTDHKGCDIAVDGSDNVIVVGKISSSESMVAKFNSSGTLQWAKKCAADDFCMAHVVADSDGNIYTMGWHGTNDYQMLFKFNSSGTLQYQRKLDVQPSSISRERDHCLDIDGDGNLYCSVGFDSSTADVIVKLPNDGSLTGTYSIGITGVNDLIYGSITETISSITTTVTSPTTGSTGEVAINTLGYTVSSSSAMNSGTFTNYNDDTNTIS